MTDAEDPPLSLDGLDETSWKGESRLWLQPGTEAAVSDATAWFDGADFHYTWAFEGQDHRGTITVADDGSARVRPSGELVLQMTNITSWGEEAPAVQMVFVRN